MRRLAAALGLLLGHLLSCGAPTMGVPREIEAGGYVRGAWPLSAARIAICAGSEFQIWDVQSTPALVRRVGLPTGVSAYYVAPVSDGRLAFVRGRYGEDRKSLQVLDLETGRTTGVRGDAVGRIEAVAASPSGRLIAWCECERETKAFTISVADAASLEPKAEAIGVLFFEHQSISVLRFSPDDRLLAFGGSGGAASLGVMAVETGRILWYRNGDSPWDVAFTPDSARFFTTNAAGWLTCFEASSGEEIWSDVVLYPYPGVLFWTVQANERLCAVDVSRDGRLVAASTDYTHNVILWDAVSGKRLKTLNLVDAPIERALFFAPSGQGLWAAGSLDTKLRYFPLE